MSDFRKGDVLTIHLTDGTSCAGRYLGASRRFLRVTSASVEASGALRELKSERLLIPRGLVKLVEVTAQ